MLEDPVPPSIPGNRFAVFASVAVAVIGVLVLFGWQIQSETLKRVHPSFVAMNPATAICLILSGIALALTVASPTKGMRTAAIVLASVVLVAASVKMAGYITGTPIRLDALLFGLELREARLRIPNQMTPTCAAALILLSFSILTFHRTLRGFSVSNLLAIIPIALGFLAVVGYVYGVSRFAQFSPVFTPMAVHSGISFGLLGMGILMGDFHFPLRRMLLHVGISRSIALRLFPAVTLFVVAVGWLRLYSEREGYVPHVMATALFVVIIVFVLTALVWWTAKTASWLEAAQRHAEASLYGANAALTDANQRMRLVLSHSADLICTFDEEIRFVSANEAIERLLGYSPAAIVGQRFAEWIHPDDREKALASMMQARSGMAVIYAQFRCRRKDGTYTNLNWSFQWASYHKTLFAVGRPGEGVDSLRAWDQVA